LVIERSARQILYFSLVVADFCPVPAMSLPKLRASGKSDFRTLGQAVRACGARPNTKSAANPAKTNGKTTILTVIQPKSIKMRPDEKDPITMVPKTRKSLKD
jgi:hypothetical protein